MANQHSPIVPSNESIDHLSTKDGYDRWATIYDTEENPLIAIEEPLVDQLLGDLRGLTVADIGCGTGRHTIRLAEAGALVQAIDFSEAMLQHAKRKRGAFEIPFRVHNLSTPLPFADQMFDRVICALVMDHISDLGLLFSEMHRVCRHSGFVVISVMHPALMLRGVQARFRDPETGRETRPESHPHQLSDYVMAAVRAGFTIDHLSEHFADETLANRLERARKYVGWPLLLLMRLAKPKG